MTQVLSKYPNFLYFINFIFDIKCEDHSQSHHSKCMVSVYNIIIINDFLILIVKYFLVMVRRSEWVKD